MSDGYPRVVQVWEDSDGDLHRSQSSADFTQNRIDGAELATRLLREGRSLGAAMRAGGLLPDGIYPALDEVFETTKLVISHWQCRDQPGYQPHKVCSDGGIFVHGDAGSWSGPYGAVCDARDVERYWLDTKARAERGRR